MMNEQVYVEGEQECSKTESGRPPPYDAGANHEALLDAVHEALHAKTSPAPVDI